MAIAPFVTELIDDGQYQSLLKPPRSHGMRSGRVYLAGGAECGQHTTDINEEMLVFLSGAGTAFIGETEKMDVGVGKVVYIPPHTPHNIKNTSDEPLSYVFCVAPAVGGQEK